MSELVNIKATVAFPAPEVKSQVNNLIHHPHDLQFGSKHHDFENYLKAAAQGQETPVYGKRREITDDRTVNRQPELNQLRDSKDDPTQVTGPVSKQGLNQETAPNTINNSSLNSEKGNVSSKPAEGSLNDDPVSVPDDVQSAANMMAQVTQGLNPGVQLPGNDVAQLVGELVSSEQSLITGVSLNANSGIDLNQLQLASLAGEPQMDQNSENTKASIAGNQQVSNAQSALMAQNGADSSATATLLQDPNAVVIQTMTTPNQSLVEATTLLMNAETKKPVNNSQESITTPQVNVTDVSVNQKDNGGNPAGNLNSAVLQAFQGKVAEQVATQNVSYHKEQLQQDLQSTVLSGKVNLVSGESKPLNLALLQTQAAVGENPDKTPVIATMQIQQHSAGQLHEMAGTNTQTASKDQLFAQIVENAKLMLAGNHSEMELNLKPDSLGRLQLKIAVENQVVTARFVAESQQVKEIIETNLNQLRDHLRENGLQVDNLTVSVGTGANEQRYNQAAGNQGDLGAFTATNRSNDEQNEATARMEAISGPKSLRETQIDLIA
jgi:flagellar hook-length control protein FliK